MKLRAESFAQTKQAFSLVELSIVLVILGLLVGGVLSGQSLIRAAELRSVTTEYNRYMTAAQTFRDKYFAAPGDMTNATAFWGDNNTSCPDAGIANGTPGTCNGDGDGMVEGATPSANGTMEAFQVWNQLSLAGLIEGSFSGTFNASGVAVIGTSMPRAKLSNGRWHSQSLPDYVGDTNIYANDYRNYFYLSSASSVSEAPVLRPEEAWNIDTKVDDGRPAFGTVIAIFWNNACAAADDGSSSNNDLNASYRLNDSTLQCGLFFNKAY